MPDLGTALLAIGAFVGGQIVISLLSEWRADRDAKRAEATRQEDARRADAIALRDRRIAYAVSGIEQTRMLFIDLIEWMLDVMDDKRGHDKMPSLRTYPLANMVLLGEAAALRAFNELLAEVIQHEPGDPRPSWWPIRAGEIRVAGMERLNGQQRRVVNGEEIIAIESDDLAAILAEQMAFLRGGPGAASPR